MRIGVVFPQTEIGGDVGLSVNTMNAGLASVDEHLDALETTAIALGTYVRP